MLIENYMGKVVGKDIKNNELTVQIEYKADHSTEQVSWVPYHSTSQWTASMDAINEIQIGDYIEISACIGKMKSSTEKVITDVYGDPDYLLPNHAFTELTGNLNPPLLGDYVIEYENTPDCSKYPSGTIVCNVEAKYSDVTIRKENRQLKSQRLYPSQNYVYEDEEYKVDITFNSGEASAYPDCTDQPCFGPQAFSDFTIHISKISSEVNTEPGWSEDMRITNDPADSINPKIAVDSNNNVHIVWEESRNGNYYDIYYTKLGNKGNTLIDDKRLTRDATYSSQPAIAIDSNNNVHMTYTTDWIYYTKLDNDGNILVDNKKLTVLIGYGYDEEAYVLGYPRIANDSNDNVHVVWDDGRNPKSELYYMKLDNNGNKLVSDKRLTYDSELSWHQDNIIDSDDNIHIAWADYRFGTEGIYYTKLDNNGNTLIDDKRVTENSESLWDLTSGIDSNDNIHIAYSDHGVGEYNTEIYYTKLDNNGNPLVDNLRLTNDPKISSGPAIAVDSNNNVHIVWEDSRDGLFPEIYYTKLDNNGNTLVEDIRLTHDPEYSMYPDIAIDSNDKVHITWTDDRDGNWEIYYKTIEVAGDGDCFETVPSDHWKGEYYNNMNLEGSPSMVRDDGTGYLNFDWGYDGPSTACGINSDFFSVRWTRPMYFDSGTWHFTATTDDGMRLFVDGSPLIVKWFNQAPTAYTADVDLTAGTHTIKVEYYEYDQIAVAKLSWEKIPPTELPDLTLSPDDISFSNPNPSLGEIVTITATIHNIGNADANNVIVQFFDGDPDNGGTQIESDQTIKSISAGGTGTAQVDWELTCESTYLFVKVDPDNLIPESNEENNEINVTTTVYEMQKLLEKMNYFFDFYEEFYNYDDNAPGADKEKESLCEVQNDDIWMCMVYPIKLSFMSGDDLTTGIGGNTWYSGPDPSGNTAFEVKFNKDEIPDELEELFDLCEFYVMFGGVPSYAPIYYDKDSNRAQILIDCWMEGLVLGLPKIKAGGKAYWFYVPSTDSIDMTDLENIYADTSMNLFSYEKSDSQKIKIPGLDIEIGEVSYKITTDGELTIGASIRPSSTGEMIPKGIAPAAKIIVDAEGNASLAVYDQTKTIFDQPPDLDVDITLDKEPKIIFEGAMATSDFEAADFIESPFDDFQYHDLKEFTPELRLMFDEIAVKVQGILTYELIDTLKHFDPYGGTIPINMEFIVFPEFQNLGRTKIFVEGPINIEVYDQSSRKLRQYDAYSPLEVSYSGSSVGNETRVITVPPTADRLILTARGIKSGKYNMTILKPIVLTNSTGTKILTYINYTINEISTQTNEIDYFDLDFRKIEYNIKKEVEAGKEISIAVREITENLDLDEDGIPDVSDNDLIFERKKTSLFAEDIFGQPGEEIVLKARLSFLDKNLSNRNIIFMIDGTIIGYATTDDGGSATISYIIPITTSVGAHQLTMISGGDDQYSESRVRASLVVVDTPPQVKITYPHEFTAVNQTVIITGEVTDSNLDSIALKIDDTQVSNSLPYAWNTTKYYDGPHIIKLTATDKSGNQNSIAIIVRVDNNIPAITIYSPVNGATYPAGSVNLNYSVSKPTAWEGYSLDGAENITLYGNTTLTGLREGTHVVTVYANDTAGNTGYASVYFIISGGKIIYVDDDFTDDPASHRWNTIQEGINDANDGDTVLVYKGTYYENVVVNKPINLAGIDYPVVDAGGSGNAITVKADNCTIDGLKIANGVNGIYLSNSNYNKIINIISLSNDNGISLASSRNNILENNTLLNNSNGVYLHANSGYNIVLNNTAKANNRGIALADAHSNNLKNNALSYNTADGIYLHANSSYSTIANNTAKRNGRGIALSDAHNNVISNNNASNNSIDGIYLHSSSNNALTNNTVNSNDVGGILLWFSSNNNIVGNTASNNFEGISLAYSSNNNVMENIVNSNDRGIPLSASSNNIITRNNALNNGIGGIELWSSSNNSITRNNALNNEYGICCLAYSSNNTITENNANSNNRSGILFRSSSNNKIYLNNFMNNTDNVYIFVNSTNIWNSPSKITYTYKGKTYKKYLGNYWSDYGGSDINGDGIGDTAYSIDSDKDIYPLMQPWEKYFQGKRILFDESHHQFWTACIDAGLVDFANELRKRGYQVDRLTDGPITKDILSQYEVFVLPGGFIGKYTFDEGPKLLSADEIIALRNFVDNGGGLFLLGCGWSWADYTNLSIDLNPVNQIGCEFGIKVNDDIIFDPTDHRPNGEGNPIFHEPFIKDYPITQGVHNISACEGLVSSLSIVEPASVKVIVTGDEDSYSGYRPGYYNAGEYPPVVAVAEYGKGRVILVTQEGFFTSMDDDKNGLINLDEYDNENLVFNIIDWLYHKF